jgi:maleamate amidohydrolase
MTDTFERDRDAEFFRERGFGLRIGFGKRPAILVVDIVKAFTDPQRMLGAELGSQIVATNQLLDAAHEKSLPIIFSTVAYEDSNFKDAGVWALKQKGVATLMAGTDGPELDPRLHYEKGDAILYKKYASCFFQVDTLIITGCTTSGCVRASAVDSCQNGFRPMVVREAVGDRSQLAHDQSLFDLDAKYADVVSTDETLTYLHTL